MSVRKPNTWRAWSSKSTFATSVFSRRVSFSSSSYVLMIKPYLEYRRVYGGGADDRVGRQGPTSGSSVCPCSSVNRIDELRVALMPLRSKVSFLGGAVSSSMLRGDSETEYLVEELVDGAFDDDKPFFLERSWRLPSTYLLLSLSQVYQRF
jgi:hypothetical protein